MAPGKRRLAAFLAVSTGAAVLFAMAIDRVVGFVSTVPVSGLIYGPHERVRYRTPEFDVIVTTNSLGLRDRELRPRVAGVTRLLALGDSFTYGWGVAVEDAWPRVLETELTQRGVVVEVINGGAAGGSPMTYAEVAERTVPVVRPDVVLVAVLQGDDLVQMAEASCDAKTPPRRGARRMMSGLVRMLYPNILAMAHGVPRAGDDVRDVSRVWKDQAADMVHGFGAAERRRFAQLDDDIREAFLRGELNPGLVMLGVKQPDRFLTGAGVDTTTAKQLIDAMAACLRRVSLAAARVNAAVIVMSVPYGAYVSARDLKSKRRLGFDVDSQLMNSSGPDDAIWRAAVAAGLPFLTVTQHFRNEAVTKRLYFPIDGHFTSAGNRLYAQAVADVLEPMLETLRQGARPTHESDLTR